MLNLLIKDFKIMFGTSGHGFQKVISALFTVLFFGAFLVVEIYLFRTILQTITNIKGAKEAFLTVFLCVTTVILTVGCLFNAKKLFFDNKDIEQLSPKPVSGGQIIFSKMLYLFLLHLIMSCLFEYPLLFAYGEIVHKAPIYFFTVLFYPVVAFFIRMGVALLLVYPLWLFMKFLKKHFLMELFVSLAVIFGLSILYTYVLDVFIKLVSKNGLSLLFSTESVAKLVRFQRYAFPVNLLLDIFINNNKLAALPFLCISVGVFGMGAQVAVFGYNAVRNFSVQTLTLQKKHAYKPISVTKALIKKEIALTLKNSDHIFSYTGLLAVQPLLITFVIRSMNASLKAGTIQYFAALVPGLTDYVDILFIMLFTVIISQGANSYITAENLTVKSMKTIPVPFEKQLFIKVAIPFIMSAVSLLVSVAVLMITATITMQTGLFAFIISLVLLFVFDVVSLWEELRIRRQKPKNSLLSTTISYLLPFIFVVSAIIFAYMGLNFWLTLLLGLLVIILCGAFPVVAVFKNCGKLFLGLEAVN